MGTYKIKNITNLLSKREPNFNSPVNIDYIDGRNKKNIAVKAGDTVYLTVSSLPLSVHRLRIKKMIEINEISTNEVNKLIKKDEPKIKTTINLKSNKKNDPIEKKNIVNTNIIPNKKTTIKKKVVEE